MTWQRVLGMPCNPQREIANVVASTVPSPPLPMRIFWETNKEGYYRTSTVSLDPCLSLATMAITQAEPSWTKNEETGNSFIPPTTNLLLSLHSSPNHFVGVWGGVELQNTRERDLIITKKPRELPQAFTWFQVTSTCVVEPPCTEESCKSRKPVKLASWW